MAVPRRQVSIAKTGSLVGLGLAILIGLTVAVIHSDHTRDILNALWVVGILALVFSMLGFLPLLGFALAPNAARRRIVVCALVGYLLGAIVVGLAAYMVIPAHVFIGMDQTRGIAQSLWQLHGEELAYAEQYRTTNLAAYEGARGRVAADLWRYLRGWGGLTLGGAALAGLVLPLSVPRSPGRV